MKNLRFKKTKMFIKRRIIILTLLILLIISIVTSCNLTNQKEKLDKLIAITTSTPIPTLTPTPTQIPKPIPTYDMPLDKNIIEHIYIECVRNDISYELVVSLMKHESMYKIDAIRKNSNNSYDYGLMQINSVNVNDFLAYGYTDLLNPYDNISYGVMIIANYIHKHQDENKALLAYNMGDGGARTLMNRGITSSYYSRSVVEYKNHLMEIKNALKESEVK